MLHVEIPDVELYDEINNEFKIRKGASIVMEHSLLSLAKWESKYHKPFLTDGEKSLEETIEYYKCMTITQNVDPSAYQNITPAISRQIDDYMSDTMSATTFHEFPGSGKKSNDGSFISAEIIYYWMISLNIPFECQKWHLNRLMTLIRVVTEKNAPTKKIPKSDLLARQRRLNEERKRKFNTSG